MLGAWQFMDDAHTGGMPDPFGTPRAVIVSTVQLDPFVARGDVEIRKRLRHFTRGLEHLQSLLEYQPMYLVVPDIGSPLAQQVRETVRGYARVKLVQVPLRYPFDNRTLIARGLGLAQAPDGPVWFVGTEGVLAIDRALTLSKPSTVRIVSVGGPAVTEATHVKAMPGYPLDRILAGRVREGPCRVLCGGVFQGRSLDDAQRGLDAECSGLTVVPEPEEREFLAFMRPGWDRRSYSRCFASTLRRPFGEGLTAALRGERRPCVNCGSCEEVCPAGIMPHLIHKYLYQDALEEAERARTDLCVACGLCSFVCPSKIELTKEFVEAQETIQRELHPPQEEPEREELKE
jgi:Na+-transporting NADH:ubiquinone oxidoreductase subunit A